MRITESRRARLARLAQILSSETRLRMLEMLRRRPLCGNAIARRLGTSQAAVSQHLRLLRDAGLVTSHRRGHFVHYCLQPEPLDSLEAFLGHITGADAE